MRSNYEIAIDLYKFYFDQTIKANIFFIGITGGVLSFVLAQIQNNHESIVIYALLVPLIFNIGMVWVLFNGISQSKHLQSEIKRLERDIEGAAPVHADILVNLIRFSLAVYILLVLGLIFAFFKYTDF